MYLSRLQCYITGFNSTRVFLKQLYLIAYKDINTNYNKPSGNVKLHCSSPTKLNT